MLLPRDKNGDPYEIDEKTGKEIKSSDGYYTSAMVSVLIGAIKELNKDITALKRNISFLKAKH